jgi:biotin transport system substrate-specific component
MNLSSNIAGTSENQAAKELLQVAAGIAVIAISAQIVIPFKPVPLTGQTFGVLLAAGILGRKKGMLSVFSYILFGTLGMPFFAGGDFGLARLAGPTGGYLMGFVAATYVVGFLSDLGSFRSFGRATLAMAAGNIVIYALGVLWLSGFTGLENVLSAGVYPFVAGDIVKILIAGSLVPAGSKLIK